MDRKYVICIVGLAAVAGAWAEAVKDEVSYLDNGVIRIGADLTIGGAITYLSASGSDENMINSYDWGRQVQMSFYSGPTPYVPDGQEPSPNWRFLGWNPIQSGDCYGNRSKVIEHKNDGKSIYVKCIPMHWPLDNVPGECTFETWITLDGPTARVRSKINNARDDATQYPARGQELPAVYTNGPYYRLFTYDGDTPFANAPLRRITKVWDTRKGPQEVEGGPWDHWYATENWAALVNEDDFGVGVWSPGTYTFCGGFAGKPGKGGPKDGPTGYIAPLRREILDHNIEYAYDYVLVVGKLDAIRRHIYAHAERNPLPEFTFDADRQSWTLQNAPDAGWPLKDAWEVTTGDKPGVLRGPSAFWDAAKMPRLRIVAAFDGGEGQGLVRWDRFGDAGAGQVAFDIVADGQTRAYDIDLAQSADYAGRCTRLSIQLPPGVRARIERVTHKADE